MSNTNGGGFFMRRELYLSSAFKTLKLSGMRILLYVLDSRIQEKKKYAKTKKGNPRKPVFINLDDLRIPYDIVQEKTGLSRKSVTTGIDDVLAKGFLELKYHGGVAKHDMSIYKWVDSWMFWKPGVEFTKRPKRPRRGFQDGTWRKRKKPQIIKLKERMIGNGNT